MRRSATRAWARIDRPIPSLTPVRLGWRAAVLELGVLWAAVAAALAATVDLGNLRTPFRYDGDSLWMGMLTQTIGETGWFQTSTRLGAPFGQNLHDFPSGADNGSFVVLKLIGAVAHDWGLTLNLYFLLSFFMVAASAWVAARLLGTGAPLAFAVGIVYTFLPFHFYRYSHLLLANYWVIPLGVLLAVRAAHGRSLVRVGGGRDLALNAATVGACVLAASFGAYYAVFVVMTIALACVATAIGHRSVRPLLHGAAAAGLVLATLVANVAGSIAYRVENGSNPVASWRPPAELDLYGLHLVEMIRPTVHSLLPFAGTLGRHLPPQPASTEANPALGLVGTVALVAMVVWSVRRFLSGRGAADPVRPLLVVTVLAWIVLAVPGGLNGAVWATGFHSLRAWNRVSVLIAFALLLWLALTLRPAIDRLRRRPHGTVLTVVAVVVLCIVAVIDQTPATFGPGRATVRHHYSDRAAFAAFERDLPSGASVLQLPVRRFPEAEPRHHSADYDLLLPYLATTHLRFSYGGMKGREAEWQVGIDALRGRRLADAATATGFDAILIDRAGYRDDAHRLVRTLRDDLQLSPDFLTSRWVAFDLTTWQRTHRPSARLRAELLGTPRLNPGSCGTWPGSRGPGFSCPESGSFLAVTPVPRGTASRHVRFIVRSPAGAGTVRFRWQGRTHTVRTSPAPTTVTLPVSPRPRITIRYTASGPGVRKPGAAQPIHVRIRTVPGG